MAGNRSHVDEHDREWRLIATLDPIDRRTVSEFIVTSHDHVGGGNRRVPVEIQAGNARIILNFNQATKLMETLKFARYVKSGQW